MSVSSNQMAALHLCENIYIPFGMETQLMMVMCHSCFLLVVPYFPWYCITSHYICGWMIFLPVTSVSANISHFLAYQVLV